MVWPGSAGWAEWSPFLDYDGDRDRAVAAGRRRGRRAGLAGAGPERDRGERDRPCGRAGAGRRAGARRRLPDRQDQGRRTRAGAWPTTSTGSRPSATPSGRTGGSGSTPTVPGTCRRRPTRCGGWPATSWSTPSSRAGRSTSSARLRVALARAGVDVPVAADESIRRATDPYLVARRGAADIAVLKVQPLGGVRACLAIAAEIGLPVVVSSALETSVGIAAGVALAAALPELPYACGLNTVRLLSDDLVDDPLVAVDGRLPVRAGRALARSAGRARCRRGHDRVLAGSSGRDAAAGRGAPTGEGRRPWVTPPAAPSWWSPSCSGPGCRRSCCRRGRGARRWRTSCSRPTRSGCSGCTSGSTSGPPVSSPSDWPRPRSDRSRW